MNPTNSYAYHYLFAVEHANGLAAKLWAIRERLIATARANGKGDPRDDTDEDSADYYDNLCDRAGLLDEQS